MTETAPDFAQLQYLLDKCFEKYNSCEFIDTDPIQVPHRFNNKKDIEISAFLTATIAWGQRKSIIKNASRLMDLIDNSPYDFLLEAGVDDMKQLKNFVHRTFNGNDCLFFLSSLKNIYLHHGGLENVFSAGYTKNKSIFEALKYFREVFLSIAYNQHVSKHISDVSANSTAKRLNMFLRWMVRSDENGVDFGIWKQIPSSALFLPLDVHTGNVARSLGLLQRKQNDWKAVDEITRVLRLFDPQDPVKYDFALFGMGVFEGKK